MEEFKKKLRGRQILLVSGLLGACLATYLSARFYEKEETASEFARGYISGFQVGILLALMGTLLVFIVKHVMALRSPERLRELYISETDERKLLIKQRAGSVGMNIASYGLVAGTVVAGNINDTVFFSLFGASLFVATVRGFLKLYFRNKF